MKKNLKPLVTSALVALTISLPQNISGAEDSNINVLNQETNNHKQLHSLNLQEQEKLTEHSSSIPQHELAKPEECFLNMSNFYSPVTFIKGSTTYLQKLVDFTTENKLLVMTMGISTVASLVEAASNGQVIKDDYSFSQVAFGGAVATTGLICTCWKILPKVAGTFFKKLGGTSIPGASDDDTGTSLGSSLKHSSVMRDHYLSVAESRERELYKIIPDLNAYRYLARQIAINSGFDREKGYEEFMLDTISYCHNKKWLAYRKGVIYLALSIQIQLTGQTPRAQLRECIEIVKDLGAQAEILYKEVKDFTRKSEDF